MSPSKATLLNVPTTKSFEPPMNIPGTSSNRSYVNSVSASPISGTSNSSPNYPLFETTPERGVEKQNDNRTMATQTEELNASERVLRAQTCPVDIPGPLLESNDSSRPIQAVRVDSPAVNEPGSSQTGQKFAVPEKPANNGLMDPKADESQQGQAGPAVASSRPAFKRPYPAQGAANSPKMGKWTRAGQLQMMSQAGQTGQTQMMTPSTSTQNNLLRTAPAGTSQMMQVTSSNVVKTTSQTGPIKQSPTTPARLLGSMSSTTPALKSNDSPARQKRSTRIAPTRPKQDVLMAPSSDHSQSGEVGPDKAEVSGQTTSSQSTSADLPPAPETGSSEVEQKKATQIVHPQPQETQAEKSQSAPSSSETVMPPPRAALWRECRSKPTVAQQNEEWQRVRMSTPIPDNSLYKIRIGQAFQANIPEESLSNSDSDRDEAIWTSPESEESQCNPATIRKEYWCTVWRQFEGRFLYEDALQHLMKNDYSIEKSFESIEVCLGKLRPRILLREAHIEHYKELLQEQAFDEEYYRKFDNKKEKQKDKIRKNAQKYSFAEVKEFYDIFHSRNIAPPEMTKNLCVCKEYFCRKLSFEPRWACANCTGQLRQMASPRLCLICQAYKEKTGRVRPISDSYWSGDEVRKILAWKSLEEKLQKEVPREDFEKFLKEKERKRIEEERFTEEEERLVQSLPKGSKKPMEHWMKEIDNPFLKNCHPSTTKIDTIVKKRKDDVMNEKAEPRPKRSCVQRSSQGSSLAKDNGDAVD